MRKGLIFFLSILRISHRLISSSHPQESSDTSSFLSDRSTSTQAPTISDARMQAILAAYQAHAQPLLTKEQLAKLMPNSHQTKSKDTHRRSFLHDERNPVAIPTRFDQNQRNSLATPQIFTEEAIKKSKCLPIDIGLTTQSSEFVYMITPNDVMDPDPNTTRVYKIDKKSKKSYLCRQFKNQEEARKWVLLQLTASPNFNDNFLS